MREIDFQITGERFSLAEKGNLLNPEEDFCAYVGDGEIPGDVPDCLTFSRRDGFLELKFDDGYLLNCMKESYPKDTEGGDAILTEYVRIRLKAIKSRTENDAVLENQYARTIALMAVPKTILHNNCKINIKTKLSKDTVARLFYSVDRMRRNDLDLDGRLISFVERYLQ